MKPNAPPPQLVMSPVFWPTARDAEEALGDFQQQLGDGLGLVVDGRARSRPSCRVDAIGSVPLAARFSSMTSSQLTPWLSNTRMTP